MTSCLAETNQKQAVWLTPLLSISVVVFFVKLMISLSRAHTHSGKVAWVFDYLSILQKLTIYLDQEMLGVRAAYVVL